MKVDDIKSLNRYLKSVESALESRATEVTALQGELQSLSTKIQVLMTQQFMNRNNPESPSLSSLETRARRCLNRIELLQTRLRK